MASSRAPAASAAAPLSRTKTARAPASRSCSDLGNRNGGTNGPDPDYYHSSPPLRGRVRLSPVGIWRRHRYRRYSADRTHRLFVVRSRGIVIFDGGEETPGLTVNFCYQNNRRKTRPSDLQEEVRFALDSSLEGAGFELSVPRQNQYKGRSPAALNESPDGQVRN